MNDDDMQDQLLDGGAEVGWDEARSANLANWEERVRRSQGFRNYSLIVFYCRVRRSYALLAVRQSGLVRSERESDRPALTCLACGRSRGKRPRVNTSESRTQTEARTKCTWHPGQRGWAAQLRRTPAESKCGEHPRLAPDDDRGASIEAADIVARARTTFGGG